jgi:hypothetical protein
LRLERGLVQERIGTLNAEIKQINPEFDSTQQMRNAGRKLGELYAELMVAERNLRAAGVNVRRVRVDERFVKGMLKKQPGKRKKVALMLARVALIEEEIAKLNPHFQRRVPPGILTYGEVRNRIHQQMAVDGVNPHETNAKQRKYQAWPLSLENRPVGANPTAFVDGLEIKKPHNPLAEIKLRHRPNENGLPPADAADSGKPPKPAAPATLGGAEPPSRLERATKVAMKAAQAVAGFMSDKESKDLDPEFVDRIIASIPAISNYGKISIRTNMMVHGGFPFDTGHGVTVPLNLGGGRQVGLIIKRINGRVEVRLVFGFQLDGQIGVIGDGSKEDGAGEGGVKLEGSLYKTEGISAHFEIRYNPETGREDFSAVQAYVRSLLAGDLPSTEDVAGRMFNFQRITKNGQHVKPIGSASGSYGAASELTDIGAISMAGTGSASGDHRWRWRQESRRTPTPRPARRFPRRPATPPSRRVPPSV